MLLTGGQTICRKLSEESMISVSRGSRSAGAARGREEGSNQNAERLQREMESDFSGWRRRCSEEGSDIDQNGIRCQIYHAKKRKGCSEWRGAEVIEKHFKDLKYSIFLKKVSIKWALIRFSALWML